MKIRDIKEHETWLIAFSMNEFLCLCKDLKFLRDKDRSSMQHASLDLISLVDFYVENERRHDNLISEYLNCDSVSKIISRDVEVGGKV